MIVKIENQITQTKGNRIMANYIKTLQAENQRQAEVIDELRAALEDV